MGSNIYQIFERRWIWIINSFGLRSKHTSISPSLLNIKSSEDKMQNLSNCQHYLFQCKMTQHPNNKEKVVFTIMLIQPLSVQQCYFRGVSSLSAWIIHSPDDCNLCVRLKGVTLWAITADAYSWYGEATVSASGAFRESGRRRWRIASGKTLRKKGRASPAQYEYSLTTTAARQSGRSGAAAAGAFPRPPPPLTAHAWMKRWHTLTPQPTTRIGKSSYPPPCTHL